MVILNRLVKDDLELVLFSTETGRFLSAWRTSGLTGGDGATKKWHGKAGGCAQASGPGKAAAAVPCGAGTGRGPMRNVVSKLKG